MVDEPRLSALLERIRVETALLGEAAARDEDALAGDSLALHGVKYAFVVAIEAAVDVCHHIIASERLPSPRTFAEAFAVVAAAGYLPAQLVPDLQRMAGFRNLLVHGYAEVDDRRVVETLQTRLGDFDAFRRAVARSVLRDG